MKRGLCNVINLPNGSGATLRIQCWPLPFVQSVIQDWQESDWSWLRDVHVIKMLIPVAMATLSLGPLSKKESAKERCKLTIEQGHLVLKMIW